MEADQTKGPIPEILHIHTFYNNIYTYYLWLYVISWSPNFICSWVQVQAVNLTWTLFKHRNVAFLIMVNTDHTYTNLAPKIYVGLKLMFSSKECYIWCMLFKILMYMHKIFNQCAVIILDTIIVNLDLSSIVMLNNLLLNILVIRVIPNLS